MALQKLISNYAAYNAWANARLIDFLKNKPKESWYKEVPSSFNSIVKTLNHIQATQEFWYSVVTETENKSNRWQNQEPVADEVFGTVISFSNQMADTFKKYSNEELAKIIHV